MWITHVKAPLFLSFYKAYTLLSFTIKIYEGYLGLVRLFLDWVLEQSRGFLNESMEIITVL